MQKALIVRIGLRPRRSALGVVPELAEFLRAAAGFGDLRGPLDGGFTRREFQDAEAAVELLGLRVGLVRDGAVGGDHQRRDVFINTTADNLDHFVARHAFLDLLKSRPRNARVACHPQPAGAAGQHGRGKQQSTENAATSHAFHSRWRLRAGQAGVRFPAAKSVWASDNEAMAMTEQEWLACDDPESMLSILREKTTDRKL